MFRIPKNFLNLGKNFEKKVQIKKKYYIHISYLGTQRIYESAILHTTMGDIHIKLFGRECPKTVENFCVHSKNG